MSFMRYLLTRPWEKKIPKNAQVVLLPDYDQKLKRFNTQEMLSGSEKSGNRSMCAGIQDLPPDQPSRLIGTKIERVA